MNKQCGFTLIEILAAFLVFILVFAFAMQLTASSNRTILSSKRYTQAALWAETKFEEIRYRGELEEGYESGSYGDFFWELTITPYEESNWPVQKESDSFVDTSILPPLLLIKVELNIYWADRGKQERFSTLVSRSIDDYVELQ